MVHPARAVMSTGLKSHESALDRTRTHLKASSPLLGPTKGL